MQGVYKCIHTYELITVAAVTGRGVAKLYMCRPRPKD